MRHALLITALLITALLAGCINDVPDLPEEVPDRQTTLEVMTEPGATVYLDDTRRGTVNESGSILIADVQPGGHELRVVHPEYFEQTRTVSLREFRRNAQTVELLARDDAVEAVSIGLFHYAHGYGDVDITVTLVGESGEYSCPPEELADRDTVPVNTLSPYYENRDTVYGYDYQCQIPQVPYGNYTLRAEADGFHTYEEPFVVNTTSPWAHIRLGYFNPVLGMNLEQGDCIFRGLNSILCDSVEISSLGTFNFAGNPHEYYLINATVTSNREEPIQLLRALIATDSWSAGRSWLVSDEIDQGETGSFLAVVSYPVDISDEIETSDDLVLSVIAEDRSDFRQTYSLLGFKNGNIERVGDAPIDRCERHIEDEVIQYGYGTLGECLRSFAWSSHSSAVVREFCEDRPAYVGSMELYAGNLTLYGRMACEDVPDPTIGSCYVDEGTIAFKCEEADGDLLENTNVRTLALTIANRMSSDVYVRNASVAVGVGSFEYDKCADVELNTWFEQGERKQLSFDFADCDTSEAYSRYSVTLELSSGGEQQQISYVVRPPRQ